MRGTFSSTQISQLDGFQTYGESIPPHISPYLRRSPQISQLDGFQTYGESISPHISPYPYLPRSWGEMAPHLLKLVQWQQHIEKMRISPHISPYVSPYLPRSHLLKLGDGPVEVAHREDAHEQPVRHQHAVVRRAAALARVEVCKERRDEVLRAEYHRHPPHPHHLRSSFPPTPLVVPRHEGVKTVVCSVFRAPREYNGEEDSECS